MVIQGLEDLTQYLRQKGIEEDRINNIRATYIKAKRQQRESLTRIQASDESIDEIRASYIVARRQQDENNIYKAKLIVDSGELITGDEDTFVNFHNHTIYVRLTNSQREIFDKDLFRVKCRIDEDYYNFYGIYTELESSVVTHFKKDKVYYREISYIGYEKRKGIYIPPKPDPVLTTEVSSEPILDTNLYFELHKNPLYFKIYLGTLLFILVILISILLW